METEFISGPSTAGMFPQDIRQVEVYPSLKMRRFPNDGERNGDQQAAYAVTAWLRRSDSDLAGKILRSAS